MNAPEQTTAVQSPAAVADEFLSRSLGWASNAGGGPTLRGRRFDRPGPTLHFVHGNGFCGGVYWPFLRQLNTRYGLFCHDIEGHGASDAPARFSGVRNVIRRIEPIIREQQLDRAAPLIGIGHSFGAALTLRAAAANPGLFRALVLLDPIVMPPATWFGIKLLSAFGRNPMSRAALRRRTRWSSVDEVLQRLHGRGIYTGWRDDALRCFAAHATRDLDGKRELCCPPRIEAKIFESPVYPWPAFAQIDCPVLLVYGRSSYDFVPVSARRAHGINPAIDVVEVDGGHCFMQEHPDTSATLVLQWLAAQDLSPGTARP
ncbi:alpha/beta hydrolase [Sinimarinibacterium sp. CAU 1509]|uniref:alpha/beta fold hydrolase n=1 Tax=Sinimarinibacterium sp. CAU 1509 TaxID=2562283 RepID=UPI0010AD5998|nr:alpha/beta hydrolase [Sinimarinibacterium sp. CAU 1509]TJY65069.1 alpha/beta hydrolase [Sinimarinibacterium sp. CAU 1509]